LFLCAKDVAVDFTLRTQ